MYRMLDYSKRIARNDKAEAIAFEVKAVVAFGFRLVSSVSFLGVVSTVVGSSDKTKMNANRVVCISLKLSFWKM